MNAIMAWTGGRAPPGQNKRSPCAGSHWPAGARGSLAPAPSTARALRWSGPDACLDPVPPAAPISVASPPCSRSSPQSNRSLPTASHDRPHAPAPSEPLACEPLVRTELMTSASPLPHPLKDWSLRETRYGSVAGMEDVLEVYQRPHDPDRPVVYLDETTKQLVKEPRVPVPAKPGQPGRHDYEYERNGTVNLFMLFAPLEGWRHVAVTERHAALDYAQVLRDLSDRHFPAASKIVLVQDNLSTHKPASLYEAFPPAEARRLVERFEWHYTPKHGSWLDMAESELSVLSAQCLDRRIPDKQTLIEEVATCQQDRNKNHTRADWQFTTADARIKLKRLYPAI